MTDDLRYNFIISITIATVTTIITTTVIIIITTTVIIIIIILAIWVISGSSKGGILICKMPLWPSSIAINKIQAAKTENFLLS